MLIAAAIARAGVCAELLEDVLLHHELVASDFILGEVRRKLREKFGFPAELVERFVSFLEASAECVAPADLPAGSCRDPNDLPVLGTAVAGRAAVLITVDKDLLALQAFRGIAIVRPGEFWRRVAQ